MTANDILLAADLHELQAVSRDLPNVDVGPLDEQTMRAPLRMLAFGAIVMGRELVDAVIAEVSSESPRGLNAVDRGVATTD